MKKVLQPGQASNPKVFISYSHDSARHKQAVLALANRLREEGVDCALDQYEESPYGNWLRWMRQQIADADFVLLICTQTYEHRFNGRNEGLSGSGVNWEGRIITQNLYEAADNHDKFIPIVFNESDTRFCPQPLRAATRYNVGTEEGYTNLYRRLTNQPAVAKPALGSIRQLPTQRGSANKPKQPTAKAPLSKPKVQSASAARQANQPLVLLMSKLVHQQLRYEIIPAEKIEVSTIITLHLTPATGHQAAFLADLRDAWDKTIAVAFGLEAFVGKVERVSTAHIAGKEVWAVSLQPGTDAHGGSFMEYALNGLSADQLAELRGRRILLNAQRQPSRGMMDRWNAQMLEGSIAGTNEYFGRLHSPFPVLFNKHSHDAVFFLNAARLFAVLYLRLSYTVKHIFKLELKLADCAKLSVKFEGQRPKQYANGDPHLIKIKGECSLADEDEGEE